VARKELESVWPSLPIAEHNQVKAREFAGLERKFRFQTLFVVREPLFSGLAYLFSSKNLRRLDGSF